MCSKLPTSTLYDHLPPSSLKLKIMVEKGFFFYVLFFISFYEYLSMRINFPFSSSFPIYIYLYPLISFYEYPFFLFSFSPKNGPLFICLRMRILEKIKCVALFLFFYEKIGYILKFYSRGDIFWRLFVFQCLFFYIESSYTVLL